MDFYNIRIINSGRNEYRGSIVIDENQAIYGICTEKNYDNEDKIFGKMMPEGIYIEIHSENEIIPVLANSCDYFPRKSIADASYFNGTTLDMIKDLIYVELTNFKDLEKKLEKESNIENTIIKKDKRRR